MAMASDYTHPDVGNDEPPTNHTGNQTFSEIVQTRLSRRTIVAGGATAVVGAMLDASRADALGLFKKGPAAAEPGFQAVSVYNGDGVIVPPGYTARPFLPMGEVIIGDDVGNPAANTVQAFENASGADMENRMGSHHDGIHFFPLPDDPNGHGILCVNHEYIDPYKTFPEGDYVTSGTRPADQVRKGIAAHGVSVVEIQRNSEGEWNPVTTGGYNRKVTGETRCELRGPVRGSSLVQTKYSPEGTHTRGTLNNCGHGTTPWNTYLTAEENWASYFAAGEGASRREYLRVGVEAASSRYGWDMADGEPTASESNPDPYLRFNAAPTGDSATDDYRNEPNCQGWITEIDPLDPASTPIKHTAMGRFAHEGCVYAPVQKGRPVVFYSGDDAQNQYIYKFVTKDPFLTGSGSELLDEGTLYVAKFHDDGTGEWLALDIEDAGFQAKMAAAAADPASVWPDGHYSDFDGFVDQADVLVNTRLAADVVGATPMDRPEWLAVHPKTREVYCALTNNSQRGGETTNAERPILAPVDEANPRAASQFGHIIRWRERGNRPWTLNFRWDIFVLAGPIDDSEDLNGSALDPTNIFASPDGIWIDDNGRLWIQTDKGTGQQVTETYRFGNNQMLCADPETGEIKRFFVGCRGQETTGVIMTPDSRTMFINLQHPGEGSESNPTLVSTYPDGPGSGSRGRSTTIIITKDDGGVIGT